ADDRGWDPPVARADGGRGEVPGSTRQAGDPAAGPFGGRAPRRDVPRAQPKLPVAGEPPAREPREIEDRRAKPADRASPYAERGVLLQVVVAALADVVGESRRQQALVERRRSRHRKRSIVHEGPT